MTQWKYALDLLQEIEFFGCMLESSPNTRILRAILGYSVSPCKGCYSVPTLIGKACISVFWPSGLLSCGSLGDINNI